MIAIDTNIFVYAFDEASPEKRKRSGDLLREIEGGVILWQVACEFLAVSRKKLAKGVDSRVPWDRLSELMAVHPLVVPTAEVLEAGRKLMTTHQLQLWDALIYAACLEARVTRLYSEDVPGATIPGLEIVNPFA